jgi:hypothetical protein
VACCCAIITLLEVPQGVVQVMGITWVAASVGWLLHFPSIGKCTGCLTLSFPAGLVPSLCCGCFYLLGYCLQASPAISDARFSMEEFLKNKSALATAARRELGGGGGTPAADMEDDVGSCLEGW